MKDLELAFFSWQQVDDQSPRIATKLLLEDLLEGIGILYGVCGCMDSIFLFYLGTALPLENDYFASIIFPKLFLFYLWLPILLLLLGGGIFIWTAGLATAEVHLFGQCICCTFIRKVYTTNKVHDDSHSAQKVCYQEALHRSLFHRSCPLTIPIATPMCGCEGTNCQTPMDSGFRLPKKDDNKLIRDLFSHSFQEFTGIASSIFVAAGQRPDVIQMAPQ